MKKALLFTGIVAMGVLSAYTFVNGSYKADVKKSKVAWVGKKVGGQHNGVISIKEGALTVSGNKLTGGTFVIDMNSIDCLDLEGEYDQKFVGHLKSDDFFSVEKFPTSKLVITKATQNADGKYTLSGDLTIKGITNPITFDADVKMNGNTIEASSNFVVDRSKYDVKYGSGSFFEGLGDKLIYDDMEFSVNIVATK